MDTELSSDHALENLPFDEPAMDEVNTLKRFSFGFAKRHGVVIQEYLPNKATIHYCPGLSSSILSEVQRFVGVPVEFIPVDNETFNTQLAAAYQNDSSEAMQMVEGIGDDMDLTSLADALPETEDLMEQEDDAPIIRLINALLTEAIKTNASDIHIETFERKLLVRMRVDGVLREIVQPRRELAPLLVSRIKVMAKLDIAEKRVPQDGRISVKVGGREVDVRVSTMPSNSGERVVLRLLDKQAGRLNLTHLGMAPAVMKRMSDIVLKPHGIILVTGPTGSGKTTTLYAALSQLNDETRNIMTVEDPIEYQLDGIGQTQVNTKVEMTFAKGLRAMLRQDPDVVMVGEIRDVETAEIAVQASLTGHLVLSTLHTNTAIGAITRLEDMGVEPFLLSSSLLGCLAQRLVRVLCDECKEPYQPDEAECETIGFDPTKKPTIFRAHGCEKCNGLGYSGRTGIYELIVFDETMRQFVHNRAGETEMERYARQYYPSIRDDGRRKVLEGATTVEEVLRVTRED